MGDSASIRWLRSLRAQDVAAAGGKGANLGELMRAGLPVPPGFVVSTAAYREAYRDQGLPNSPDAIPQKDVSAVLRSAVREAYEELGGGLVAVRSSATAEDSAMASFAGQHPTLLNVAGTDDVLDGVQRCWAGAHTPEAVAYRERAGTAEAGFAVAVLVQRMVPADCAGVVFTAEPVSRDRDVLVIEAVEGLGDGLVSGRVSPMHYEVSLETIETLRRYGDVAASGRRAWLDDLQVAELATLGLRAEAHLGAGQDMEWAQAEGIFWILQSRPITALSPDAIPSSANPQAGR